MKILITGSNGLIGGEAVQYFESRGHRVVGIDNNQRKEFFGEGGDTLWNLHRIFHTSKNYEHHDVDIRVKGALYDVFFPDKRKTYTGPFDVVIHCAAQPSHDFATNNPQIDYDVNVSGTRNLLELTKKYSPDALFIFMSTNKVYDDHVNSVDFLEATDRHDYPCYYFNWPGFNEETKTGASNVFGRNKLEADEMVQAYSNYGLKTVVLRGGCLTGPGHSGVEAHGFLNYLVKCAITGKQYKINGFGGKQVRDNIHSCDVVTAIAEIIKNPKSGQVYNIGGGRENSVSILEAVKKIESLIGRKIDIEYLDSPRVGDHRCYITDMTKFKKDYPDWKLTKSVDQILKDILEQDYWGKYSEHEDTRNYDELNENSLVFDIGGYRGAWSAHIIEKYNPNVFIFEPVREFYHDCLFRFKDNPKVSVWNFGLGKEYKRLTIAKQGVNSSVYRGGDGQTPLAPDSVYGDAVTEEIVIHDVSYLVKKGGQEVDLVSINCEGGEFDILPSLIESGEIKKFKNVQVQFHSFHPNAHELRERIRKDLSQTHIERFNYPFVWESWQRNS